MKRRILCRPAAALLPLGLAVAALMGREEAAARVFLWMVLGKACTGAMAFANRRAAGAAMSGERLRGGWTCAALITMLGGGALVALADAAYSWLSASPAEPSRLPLAALGVFLALEGLFVEHLYANQQGFSANLLECLTAVLLVAAILMGGEIWWFAAGALALGIAVIAGVAIAGNPLGRPCLAPLREIPGAAARELLYPVVALFLYFAFAARSQEEATRVALVTALMGGEAIFCGSQSAFRRSRSESAAAGWWLSLGACAISAAASFRAAAPALLAMEPGNSAYPSPLWGGGGLNGAGLLPALLWSWGALAALWTGTSLAPRALVSLLAATAAALLPVACWGEILPLSAIAAQWTSLALAALAMVLRLSDLREMLLRHRARRLRRR